MKRFLFFMVALLMAAIAPVFAQDTVMETPTYETIFLTFPALTAGVVLIVKGLKALFPSMKGIVTQVVSWLSGIAICFFGWFFHLGFLDGLPWYIALAYGIGISLASNGIADTGLIQWLIGLFTRRQTSTE